MPKTIWLTYAWADNSQSDVDFVAQELQRSGLVVKLDRWNIVAGRRLWDQLAEFIANPSQSDAWLLYATPNSLGSEACKEEFAYALDRALNCRGQAYPVIGLFPSSINQSLIPPGIRTRLYVSLSDPQWKERIVLAAEGRSLESTQGNIPPYFALVHTNHSGGFSIEVRPRAGSWVPFIFAIPENERSAVQPSIMHGPANRVTTDGMLIRPGEGSNAGWFVLSAGNEATPTMSYYLHCKKLPSKFVFGVDGNASQQYTVTHQQ